MTSLKEVFDGTTSVDTNYIQYAVYLPPVKATIPILEQTKCTIDSLVQPLVADHLWQKDKFELHVAYSHKKDPDYPFLFGLTRFGDCMNDEWFIIYLLYHISRHLPDAIIAVSDNDGEILLIEAALVLPAWLDPSNSDHRIYVYQGQLHIIPLPSSPADIFSFMHSSGTTASKDGLSRQEALALLQTSSTTTKAEDTIQHIILERLQPYEQSQQQRHELHHARTLLANAEAAYVLLSVPQLLPLAVEAFYLRDPVSLKVCATMRRFSPQQQSLSTHLDLVLPWTRTTYAQTVHQQFYAPKPFRLPPKQHALYDTTELGMKLLCGLEMLYASSESLVTETGKKGEDGLISDLVDAHDMMVTPPTSLDGRTPRQVMDDVLAQYSPSALEEMITKTTRQQPDSLDWLNVYPDELEAMLQRKMDTEQGQHDDDGHEEDMKGNIPVNLEEMMSKFEQFLEKSQSGVEGVHLPGEEQSDGDNDDSEEDNAEDQLEEEEEEEDIQKQVSFNFDSFMKILNQGSAIEDMNKEETKDLSALTAMMDEMDREIESHEKIGGSFVRSTHIDERGVDTEAQNEDDENENAPVNVQLNLIQNVLESFKGQHGLPGPAGNLLRQFNIALPVDREDNDDNSDNDNVNKVTS